MFFYSNFAKIVLFGKFGPNRDSLHDFKLHDILVLKWKPYQDVKTTIYNVNFNFQVLVTQ